VKESFAVIGLSKFGYQAALGLAQAGAAVVAVDKDRHLVQRIAPHVANAVCANATDWEVLEHVGVFDVDVAVLGIRSAFDAAVLLTHHLKTKSRVKRIVAQADTEEKLEALRVMGADVVVFPERDTADHVVKLLTMPDLVEHIELSPKAAIIEVKAPPEYAGKSLVELDIRREYDVYVIGIKRLGTEGSEPEVSIPPAPDARFRDGDTMLLLGDREDLERLRRKVLGAG
jgi:trk system potassium uptake protein TrkA